MKTSRPLVAFAAAAVLMLTGCQSGATPAAGQDSSASSTDNATDEPAEAVETPTVSPAMLERAKDKKGKYKDGNRSSIGGIVSWEILVQPGLNKALGKRVSTKAEPFIAEHYLREDRWVGSHQIKSGELDSLKDKTTPALYAKVERAVLWLDKIAAKYDGDSSKIPAKLRDQVAKNARIAGHFVLNADTVDGGTGATRYEVTRKVVYVPTDGDAKGAPTTWISVKTRNENNTGTGREFTMWQGWKQVDGEWLVFASGWAPK